jgi:predicted nucleotidyltransferase component of viral defense system
MTGEFEWFNQDQKERDYLQRLLLREVYKNSGKDTVFKGGTALQKVYGLGRFSDDLDFALNNRDALLRIDESLESFGTNVCEIVNDFESERIIEKARVLYRIAALHPESKEIRTITIDVSYEHTLLEPDAAPVSAGGDSFLVYVMARSEILAEKIRAIFDEERNKARDLYDLWFLIRGGTDIDISLISKKLGRAGQKYSFGRLQARIRTLGNHWEELTPLMDKPPSYGIVAKDVIDAFRYLEA